VELLNRTCLWRKNASVIGSVCLWTSRPNDFRPRFGAQFVEDHVSVIYRTTKEKAPVKAQSKCVLQLYICGISGAVMLDLDPYSLKYLSTALRIRLFIVVSLLIPMNFKLRCISGGMTTVTRFKWPPQEND
jgi:hypothetical protein